MLFYIGRAVGIVALAIMFVMPLGQRADAANISIDSGTYAGLVEFNFAVFEGGFSINGSTPTVGGSFFFGDTTLLNFTGQWIDLGVAVASSRTVYWVDPSAPTAISDRLMWSVTPSGVSGLATISGSFQSGGLGALPIGVSPSDIIVRQADGSHNPFDFFAAFLTGDVTTDLGSANTGVIPLPAALPLMAVGLGVLGFAGARRRMA